MAALSEEAIEEHLGGVPAWRRQGAAIEREWERDDFAAALAFVNEVGELAEERDHHPDILLHGWNKVRLTLSTHSEGGLTEGDFELARAIDGLT